MSIDLSEGGVIFDKAKTEMNVTLPEYLHGASGYMVLSSLSVKGIDDEEYSLFTAFTNDGRFLTQEDAEKLFLLGGEEILSAELSEEIRKKLSANKKQHANSKIQDIDTRNMVYFNEEEERIFRWEKDLIGSIEKELDVVKKSIREHERQSRHASNLEEKLAITKKIEELERQKRKKRNELADREDEVGEKRRVMIAELDKRRIQSTSTSDIFVISWKVL
jgi:transcriptional antiterminator